MYIMSPKRAEFYARLIIDCFHPEDNFNKIKSAFQKVLRVPDKMEYDHLLSCLRYICEKCVDEDKAIQLIGNLPWHKTNFHYSSYSDTPIHYAVDNKRIKIVKYLIDERNISPNLTNNKGETLLHKAVKIIPKSDALEMVRVLLDRGADPRIRTAESKTVIGYLPDVDSYASFDPAASLCIKEIKRLLDERNEKLEAGGRQLNTADYSNRYPLSEINSSHFKNRGKTTTRDGEVYSALPDDEVETENSHIKNQ